MLHGNAAAAAAAAAADNQNPAAAGTLPSESTHACHAECTLFSP